jgi:hypothetical protein
MKSEIQKTKTVTISNAEIQQLYPQANTGRRYYVDTNSHQFVDEIIELYFDSKGYDFWGNPYPEVTEWRVVNNEIIMTYIENIS